MLISITLISYAIAFIEGFSLFKKRMWKELIWSTFLLWIAILIVAAKLLGFPTPLKILHDLLSPLGRTIFKSR